jgi:KDO2-lipid IV(A) lauroyltransferase
VKKPTLEDRFEYVAVLATVKVLQLLPRRAAVWAGGFLGRITFDLLRFRREVTVANIKRHLRLEAGAGDAVALGRRSYVNFGKGIADFARLPCTRPADIKDCIETEGLEYLDRALSQGRGAVLVTGHFGSWELMGCALVEMGYPLTFVVGVQRNRLVQHLMNRLRGECRIPVIEPTSLLATTRVLRDNRFIAMLSDQDAGRHGVFVEFLGEAASTPAGAARLAVLTGSPVITGFIVRLDAVRHRIVIEEPIEVDRSLPGDEAARSLTRAFTASIESYVRRYPDHYLWAHRRWKTRPD